MFKRIDHVEINTADFQGTIDFYERVFGFKTGFRQQFQTPETRIDVAYLTLHGAALEVVHWADQSLPATPQPEALGYRMMALEVEDMEAALDHLKSEGIEPSWGPVVSDKYIRAEVLDINGFRIELRQWLQPVTTS